MSNLIPTQRIDKNGHAVIRHMRTVASAASNMSGVPAPSVAQKRTMKERIERVDALLRKTGKTAIASKTRKWLAGSVPEELERLDVVMDGYDDLPVRERGIAQVALGALSASRGKSEFIHEILALRSAFSSEWSVETQASMMGLPDFIYGLREAFGLSLDHYVSLRFRDEQELREAVAVTRFAYELDRRFPRQSFRPAEHAYIDSTGISYLQHKDHVLVSLLREHPDRVGDLIEFSAEHLTCDPQALRAHLEHNGPTSLSSGYL